MRKYVAFIFYLVILLPASRNHLERPSKALQLKGELNDEKSTTFRSGRRVGHRSRGGGVPVAHAIDSEGCKTEWGESPARSTCNAGNARSAISTSMGWGWSENGTHCYVSTQCARPSGSGPDPHYVSTEIVVAADRTDDLENCMGTLTDGSC